MQRFKFYILMVYSTLVWFITLIVPQMAPAGIFYVDINHPLANDGNAGSLESPWLTIQHAVDQVNAGDTVYIRAGIYHEAISLTGTRGTEGKSGIPGQYISYQGYPGEIVILDGSVIAEHKNGIVSGKAAPGSRTVNYIRISDLHIRNFSAGGIAFSNNGLEPAVGSSYIEIDGVSIYNCGKEGILFEGGKAPHTTHHIGVRNCFVFNNDHNHGIKFTGDDAGELDGEHIHDSIIENCESYNNAYMGIHVSTGNHDITIRNNICYDNGWNGIEVHEVWDSVIEFNRCFENGQSLFSDENNGIAVYLSDSILVQMNWLYNNLGHGLKVWQGLSGLEHSPQIYSNIIFANNKSGIYLSENVKDTQLFHNTIAFNTEYGVSTLFSLSGHLLINNIFYRNQFHFDSNNGNISDYNIYFPDIQFNEKGANDFSANPGFVDENADNFYLKATSVAINAATDVNLSMDIAGNSRPQLGAFDIGAYEYYVDSNVPGGSGSGGGAAGGGGSGSAAGGGSGSGGGGGGCFIAALAY